MAKKLTIQEKARRLWVRALRSGKYGWGTGELRPDKNKYCCLGVLCEVAIKQGIIGKYNPAAGGLTAYPKVMEWVGLIEPTGVFDDSSLADINDDALRNPFKKIANLIEKEPDGLFINKEQE